MLFLITWTQLDSNDLQIFCNFCQTKNLNDQKMTINFFNYISFYYVWWSDDDIIFFFSIYIQFFLSHFGISIIRKKHLNTISEVLSEKKYWLKRRFLCLNIFMLSPGNSFDNPKYLQFYLRVLLKGFPSLLVLKNYFKVNYFHFHITLHTFANPKLSRENKFTKYPWQFSLFMWDILSFDNVIDV